MPQQDFLADLLAGALQMLKVTLADFSDADMLARPVPGANHALWQLGHLIHSHVGMLAAAGAAMPDLPADFGEKFSQKSTSIDDPAVYPTKGDLLALFDKVNAAAIAFARSADAATLERPAPERIRPFAPTVAHVLAMASSHVAMHMGQMQVIRRRLGKPILF